MKKDALAFIFAFFAVSCAASSVWAASSKTKLITDTSSSANTVPFINAAPADDSTAATALGVLVGGTEMMRVTATGSVGIKTMTPAATEDINGDLRIGTANRICATGLAGALQYSTASGFQGCNGNAWSSLAGSTGTGSPVGSFGGMWSSGSGSFQTSTNPYTGDYTCPSGFVSKQVSGGCYTDCNGQAASYSIAYCSASGGAGGTAAGSSGQIQYNSSGLLAGASNFVYTASGSVGIGTTTPAYTLDVNGSINANNIWRKIVDVTVSNASTYTVSGLNGNVNKLYHIILNGSVSSNAEVGISVNGDTGANYNNIRIHCESGGSGICGRESNAGQTYLCVGRSPGGGAFSTDGTLAAVTGAYARTMTTSVSSGTPSNYATEHQTAFWTNTTSNVTSLVFNFAGSSAQTFSGEIMIYTTQ